MAARKPQTPDRRKRRLWIVILCTPVVLLIGAAITLKILFTSDRLKAMVIPRLEEATGRTVSIGDIDLTMFPGLAVKIDSLAVSNAGGPGFSRSPIASLDQLVLKVRLAALFRGNLEVTTMVLEHPRLLIEVNSRGVPNYAGMLGTASADSAPTQEVIRDSLVPASEGGMLLLSNVRIVDGTVRYINRRDSTAATFGGLNHTMRLEIQGARGDATIDGQTSVSNFSYGSPEKPMVSGLRLTLDEQMEYLKEQDSLVVKKGAFTVQDIGMLASGSIGSLRTVPVFHLALHSNNVNISDLLSLIPEEYLKKAEGMRGTGVANIRLALQGPLSDSTSPTITGSVTASDASIQYAGLPKPVSNIRIFCGFIRSKTEQMLNIEQCSASLGGNPLAFSLKLDNFNDPDIDLSLDASMNLAEAGQYYPLERGTELGGTVSARMKAAGKIRTPEALQAEGTLTFSHVMLKSPASAKPVRDLNGVVTFDNQVVQSKRLSLNLGNSDLALGFTLTHYLSLISEKGGQPRPVGQLSLSSRHLYTADIMTGSGAGAPQPGRPAAAPPQQGAKAGEGGLPLPNAELDVTATVGTLTLERFEFKNVRAALHIGDGVMTIQNFALNAFDGSATAKGMLDLRKPELPSFNLDMNASNVDAHALLPKFTSFGERLYGRLNMSSTVRGLLDDTLGLQTRSLDGQGHVHVVNGRLTGVSVNKSIADLLKLPNLENIEFKDWTNDFTISGGRLMIKDLKIRALDADYVVNGSQGFDGSLDYSLALVLPDRTASRTTVPGFAGEAINLFRNSSGRVQLDFKVGGTTDRPTLSLDTQPALKKAGELAKQKAAQEAKKLEEQAKKKAGDLLKNLLKKK